MKGFRKRELQGLYQRLHTAQAGGGNAPIEQPRKRHKFLIILLILLGSIILAVWRHHANAASKNRGATQPVSVVLTTARTVDVPVYLSALGSVSANYTVVVRTQVSGQLLRVLFSDGQLVKAGDLLAEIDSRPYQAQLLQYQGQLARDSALLTNAKLDLERYKKLWKQDSVAKQTLDTQVALVNQYEGSVKLDQGLIESTRVNLAYCRITAPSNGRVGFRQIDPGNFVQPSDLNGIVIINMVNPIKVIFSIPEDDLPQVMDQIRAGKILEVKTYDRTQKKLLATGKLLTVDNQIDPTTGTIKLEAIFQNDDNHLFPNQFVNVQLLVDTLRNATVVPTAALQHGVQGDYVYLVDIHKQIVNAKSVVVGVTTGDFTSISSGITSGQSIVVEGADKLDDGASVVWMQNKSSTLP